MTVQAKKLTQNELDVMLRKHYGYLQRRIDAGFRNPGDGGVSVLCLDSFNLSGLDFSNRHLTFSSFERSDLTGCNFEGSNLIASCFTDADCTRTNFSYANLVDSDFRGANLCNTNFGFATLAGVEFETAELQNVNLTDAKLAGLELDFINLTGFKLRGHELLELTSFIECVVPIWMLPFLCCHPDFGDFLDGLEIVDDSGVFGKES